ncbi:MAG: MMPL family transporter [Planctomycetes bacterium]|nr:MMPL family transporter [Planctomycetota bacterium]
MRDMQWLERNVGPLTPIEIILRFKSECPLTLLDRIELVDHVDDGLRRGVGRSLRGTMTALTFVRPIPTPAAYMRRSLIESRLQNENMLQRLMDGPYVAETDEGQAWRISLRVEVANDLDYGKYVTELRRKVSALFRSKWASKSNKTHRQRWKDGLESVDQIFTGAMPLADRAHRTLLRDLVVSFLTAFGMVTIVLIFALRSVVAGLVSMLPTVLPTILVFGTMGWLSARVDVGSVMTASVALGIAVDDLLHFLAWFQRESRQGASRSEAVRRSLRHCGRAMVQTTLICGFGLIVFALSDFVPAQRFAWMMLILLFGALVADLVLLPAILISPVGRCFVPRDAGLRSSDE